MSRTVLALDPDNADAIAYEAAADRANGGAAADPARFSSASRPSPLAFPTSFANGRYEVKRFLGEGGKKKVYLAHDTLLDRDVAFALIKTEGLDEAARERITREAQAMGRLGAHPHIVTVFDIGEEDGQPYLVLPLLPGGDVEGLIEKARTTGCRSSRRSRSPSRPVRAWSSPTPRASSTATSSRATSGWPRTAAR